MHSLYESAHFLFPCPFRSTPGRVLHVAAVLWHEERIIDERRIAAARVVSVEVLDDGFHYGWFARYQEELMMERPMTEYPR